MARHVLSALIRRPWRGRKFAVLVAGLGCVALMLNGCANGLFYYPDARVYSTPDRVGLPYQDVWFTSRDGSPLHGWFIPATTPGPALGTVVHFHGNAQNMTAHYGFVSWLPAEGFNVFVFDYRGYGASAKKKPTRQGTFEDGIAALAYVRGRADLDPQRMILYGQSLGGALALAVAGETHPAGVQAVIAESAFSTYRGAAGDGVGANFKLGAWLRPLTWLLVSGDHNPKASVDAISPVPLLLIHGTADTVVSYRHAEILFKKARQPKQLLPMPGAGHTAAAGSADIRRQIVAFLNQGCKTKK